MFRSHAKGEDGYGLPATILMMIIFAIMGIVGLQMARQEIRAQAQLTSREAAFYAAETGLAKGLDNWDVPFGVVLPGSTWVLHGGALPGGTAYRVTATKLDDGSAIHAMFAIRSVGRAKDGTTQPTGFLVATRPIMNPFEGALESRDTAYITGNTTISGFDHIPGVWGAYCGALDDPEGGVVLGDTMRLGKKGGKPPDVQGVPPYAQSTDTTNFFDFGDIKFDDLAADADITLSAGERVDGPRPQPSYNADGSCDTTDPYNWGDPLNSGAPCSGWFPIIYVPGDFEYAGQLPGQGILLVEGNLTAEGGATFYGPVIVKGKLQSAGNFTFYGGVKAAETDLAAGTAEIYYSKCIIERALSQSRAAKPQPVTDRPWYRKR